MLQTLLQATNVNVFLQQCFGKMPHARKSAIPTELFDWAAFDAVVAASPARDLLVVKNGAVTAEVGERPVLFAKGCSLVVRHAEERHPILAEMAKAFARELRGQAHIQLFATPQGFHSFGWHYDAEHVFLLQTRGHKTYFLRQNTVNPRPRIDAMPEDQQYEREKSPAFNCELFAGDWLYLPSGMWHRAECRDDALSLSVGVWQS